MAMLLIEQEFEAAAVPGSDGLLTHLRKTCVRQVSDGLVPVRFVVTSTTASGSAAGIALTRGDPALGRYEPASNRGAKDIPFVPAERPVPLKLPDVLPYTLL